MLAILGCALLFVIGVQPPNDRALWIIGGSVVVLLVVWVAGEGKRFPGPPTRPFSRDPEGSAI